MPAQNQMLHAADWMYVETPGYRRRCEDKEVSNWRVPLLEVFRSARCAAWYGKEYHGARQHIIRLRDIAEWTGIGITACVSVSE